MTKVECSRADPKTEPDEDPTVHRVLRPRYVQGRQLLRDWMVILDIVIIFCGYAELLLRSALASFWERDRHSKGLELRIQRV